MLPSLHVVELFVDVQLIVKTNKGSACEDQQRDLWVLQSWGPNTVPSPPLGPVHSRRSSPRTTSGPKCCLPHGSKGVRVGEGGGARGTRSHSKQGHTRTRAHIHTHAHTYAEAPIKAPVATHPSIGPRLPWRWRTWPPGTPGPRGHCHGGRPPGHRKGGHRASTAVRYACTARAATTARNPCREAPPTSACSLATSASSWARRALATARASCSGHGLGIKRPLPEAEEPQRESGDTADPTS